METFRPNIITASNPSGLEIGEFINGLIIIAKNNGTVSLCRDYSNNVCFNCSKQNCPIKEQLKPNQ